MSVAALAKLRAEGRIVAELGGPRLISPRGILPVYTVRWYEAAGDGPFFYSRERSFWGVRRALRFIRTMVWVIPADAA